MNYDLTKLVIRCSHDDRTEPPEDEWENESFFDFIKRDPILHSCILGSCVIPPKCAFDEFFLSGRSDAGMGGGSVWKSFKLTNEQYESILAWALSETDMPFNIIQDECIIDSVSAWRKAALQSLIDYRLNPEWSLAVINSNPTKFAFDFHIANLSSSLFTFRIGSKRDGRFSNLTEENVSNIETGFIKYAQTHQVDDRWLSVVVRLASDVPIKHAKFLQTQIQKLITNQNWHEAFWLLKALSPHIKIDLKMHSLVNDSLLKQKYTKILWKRFQKSSLYSNDIEILKDTP